VFLPFAVGTVNAPFTPDIQRVVARPFRASDRSLLAAPEEQDRCRSVS
jgi:hypothetical protein